MGKCGRRQALKMFFLSPLCHQERVTFVLLQTPRAVSFCVHWIFVFTRLPSAASVQHPAGRSAQCRPECRPERSALNFVNPCPAAELSWCWCQPSGGILFYCWACKISKRLVAAGESEMFQDWANMDLKEHQARDQKTRRCRAGRW